MLLDVEVEKYKNDAEKYKIEALTLHTELEKHNREVRVTDSRFAELTNANPHPHPHPRPHPNLNPNHNPNPDARYYPSRLR